MGQLFWKIGSYQYSTPKLCNRKCSTSSLCTEFTGSNLIKLFCFSSVAQFGGVASLQCDNFSHKILLLVMNSNDP